VSKKELFFLLIVDCIEFNRFVIVKKVPAVPEEIMKRQKLFLHSNSSVLVSIANIIGISLDNKGASFK